ncbi:MAG: hypothetical protein ABIZ52_04900 [Candidatus Limnocylindrales bacterium]
MTSSELAILALGLLLGAASGAALVVTFGSRPTRSEIRVTVTRDAVPRRSETLSQDAFAAAPAGPAPGGPGDRREVDRDPVVPRSPAQPWRPAMQPVSGSQQAPDPVAAPAPDRTPVPSFSPAVAIAIEPEMDRELEDLRKHPTHGSQLERMLRGEHRAMVEVVDAIAGEDSRQRRTWEVLLGRLVESMADVAVRESVIDLPMGTAFWDAFTVEQCRRIVAALASMDYRYDGHDGWVDGRTPAYRDLTRALADVGVEPRRLRAWPNQSEIANLLVGARPAPDELLAAAGPDYTAENMQTLLGEHAAGLADLWVTWEAVRPALFDETVRVDETVTSRAESAPGR